MSCPCYSSLYSWQSQALNVFCRCSQLEFCRGNISFNHYLVNWSCPVCLFWKCIVMKCHSVFLQWFWIAVFIISISIYLSIYLQWDQILVKPTTSYRPHYTSAWGSFGKQNYLLKDVTSKSVNVRHHSRCSDNKPQTTRACTCCNVLASKKVTKNILAKVRAVSIFNRHPYY